MAAPSIVELVATTCFGLAILHTFLVKRFQHWAHRYPSGSVAENLLHLLGEIEVVFGLWAAVYLTALTLLEGAGAAISYTESRNFTEPAFVFVIMTVCSSQPILTLAERLIAGTSRLLPLPSPIAYYATTLILGPLLGSFITEPAAMTVTALLLLDRYYSPRLTTEGGALPPRLPIMSRSFMYATLGLLFVNISIGGTLTPFAAPPVLMVASKWQWDLGFMMSNFGWKAVLAVTLSTALITFRFRKELQAFSISPQEAHKEEDSKKTALIPGWVSAVHLVFLVLIVATAHYMVVFVGMFLFFLGLVSVTQEYQKELRLKEGLLVGFFLGGLVVLGGPQRWWLEPILTQLDALPLYLGAMGLTAITDNAALTYLGAQVPGLAESSRYALVAGAVVGGGLTVIANAPNPAGFGLLNSSFGEEGISPLSLFLGALVPTIIAALAFWIL